MIITSLDPHEDQGWGDKRGRTGSIEDTGDLRGGGWSSGNLPSKDRFIAELEEKLIIWH